MELPPPGLLRRLTYSDNIRSNLNRFTSIPHIQNDTSSIPNNTHFAYIQNHFANLRTYDLPHIPSITPLMSNEEEENEELSFYFEDYGLVSKTLVENTSIYVNDADTFCPICQDNIEIGQVVRKTKCEHVFHISCIETWFIKKKMCPLCKNVI